MIEFAEDYLAAFEKFIWDPDEFFEKGDQVVALVTQGRSLDALDAGLWVSSMRASGRRPRDDCFLAEGIAVATGGRPPKRDTHREMSQVNLEIVRRLYEVVNASGIGAVAEFAHPDVEVVPPPNWPEASTLRGREQLEEFARGWMETFQGFKVEPERFVDAGGQRVVVYVRDRGRIRGSDTEIDTRLIHVWTLVAGKIVRWQVFADEAQALEAGDLTA